MIGIDPTNIEDIELKIREAADTAWCIEARVREYSAGGANAIALLSGVLSECAKELDRLVNECLAASTASEGVA